MGDGFVVCFDVSNRGSFEHVSSWVSDIHKNARGDVDVVLCGCKCDLPESSRQVSAEEAEALAQKYDIKYFEASAKQNINVNEVRAADLSGVDSGSCHTASAPQMFLALATTIKRRKFTSTDDKPTGRGDVDLKGQPAGDKRGCC